MCAWRIRPAVPADAAALAHLRYEFRSAFEVPAEPEAGFTRRCTEWMRAELAGDRWQAWVAENDTVIVGTIWVELIDKLPNPVAEPERHAYLSNLYVRPLHRGSGAGERLLAVALAECDARGIDAVLLWPTEQSRPLYARHGFSPGGDLMERRLSRPAGGSGSAA
jgi:GNAT superfamily N-acetyltransferase